MEPWGSILGSLLFLTYMYVILMQAGIVGWSKAAIEKQTAPGSSSAWKRKDFFQLCCDPQLTCGLARGKHGRSD